MILGIQFTSVYPEPIHRLDNGLTVFRSKFLPSKPGEIACIGGPIECIHNISSNIGASNTVRYLANFINGVSAGYVPKINFFPSSNDEMERNLAIYADKGIPQFDEYSKEEADIPNQTDDDVSTGEEMSENNVQVPNQSFDDNVGQNTMFIDEVLTPDVSTTVDRVDVCDECIKVITETNQVMTVQSELRKFFERQEAGLDTTFRCIKCRDCKQCLKGAGEERKSMMQEAHQEIIRESVFIDKELNRGVAKLPFITDPTGRLTNNTRLATKRLENVCRKYGSDPEVRDMINAAFDKLISRGHIVYLEDLTTDLQQKIKKAKVSYTIPWDVAFKEDSVTTPARPVFDASSKTPGGNSLNDLLAKGSPDMVRLIDMVLGWRIGPSALIGDIRQFYNSVQLHEDHWQFQKILLKENLDPASKTMTAIIKTLIYGVKPVGG